MDAPALWRFHCNEVSLKVVCGEKRTQAAVGTNWKVMGRKRLPLVIRQQV